jgi:hypothetical protein
MRGSVRPKRVGLKRTPQAEASASIDWPAVYDLRAALADPRRLDSYGDPGQNAMLIYKARNRPRPICGPNGSPNGISAGQGHARTPTPEPCAQVRILLGPLFENLIEDVRLGCNAVTCGNANKIKSTPPIRPPDTAQLGVRAGEP